MSKNKLLFFINFLFFQKSAFFVATAVFCWKHYKNSLIVFSEEHSFSKTQLEKPTFWPMSKNTLLGCFWCCSCFVFLLCIFCNRKTLFPPKKEHFCVFFCVSLCFVFSLFFGLPLFHFLSLSLSISLSLCLFSLSLSLSLSLSFFSFFLPVSHVCFWFLLFVFVSCFKMLFCFCFSACCFVLNHNIRFFALHLVFLLLLLFFVFVVLVFFILATYQNISQ